MNTRNFTFRPSMLPVDSLSAYSPDDPPNDPPVYEFDLAKALADPKAKAIMVEWAERDIAQPLKQKNNELLEKYTKYKVKNEDGTEAYLDPVEALTALRQVKAGQAPEIQQQIQQAVDAANARSQQQIEALTQQLNDATKGVTTERDKRYDTMMKNALKTELLSSGIKSGKMHLHEKYLLDYVAVVEDGGEEKIVIMDEKDKSKPKYGANGLMKLSEFINEYKLRSGVSEDWNPANGGRQGSGTGLPGKPGQQKVSIDGDLPATERLKILRRSQG